MKEDKENNKKYRKAIFGVVYSKNSYGKIEYLILKRKKHWRGWEFPKGKIEKNETKRIAARREVKEETGLKILKIKHFKEEGNYIYKKILWDRPGIIGLTYELFAVEVKKDKPKLDPIEHNGYEWISFKDTHKKLTWPNQKRCLKIVNKWLNER